MTSAEDRKSKKVERDVSLIRRLDNSIRYSLHIYITTIPLRSLQVENKKILYRSTSGILHASNLNREGEDGSSKKNREKKFILWCEKWI